MQCLISDEESPVTSSPEDLETSRLKVSPNLRTASCTCLGPHFYPFNLKTPTLLKTLHLNLHLLKIILNLPDLSNSYGSSSNVESAEGDGEQDRHTRREGPCLLLVSPGLKKCLKPLGPLNWFEAREPFSFQLPKVMLFCFMSTNTAARASSKQYGACCGSWDSYRDHCGFAIKLLSAISEFIVLIVFTWLLDAHALPRGCPHSLAPVIIFQRDRCPSLPTVQPHQKLICSQVSRKEEEEFIPKSTAYLDKTQRNFVLAH